jgi:hypothetical protein
MRAGIKALVGAGLMLSTAASFAIDSMHETKDKLTIENENQLYVEDKRTGDKLYV